MANKLLALLPSSDYEAIIRDTIYVELPRGMPSLCQLTSGRYGDDRTDPAAKKVEIVDRLIGPDNNLTALKRERFQGRINTIENIWRQTLQQAVVVQFRFVVHLCYFGQSTSYSPSCPSTFFDGWDSITL
ncbi:hypothetical protein [Brucella tritici]|uniref:hypothetical protein n=1 Tax=Brucella tritici TaxID=94626 RepID=UPI003D6D3762